MVQRRDAGIVECMPNPDRLTNQERQVVLALLSGYSNRELAEQLFVSVKTIETHLTRIYRKLGCRSRVHLITSYYAGGLGESLTETGAAGVEATPVLTASSDR
jgi:DNA-binding CsgD family transcriptional regulator